MPKIKAQPSDISDCMSQIHEISKHIYEKMGQGHDEKVYQRALAVALRKQGIHYRKEVTVELFYEQVWVGEGKADFVVSSAAGHPIVIELKAVDGCAEGYKKQLSCYMNALNAGSGMLINFWQPGNSKMPEEQKNRLVSHFVKHQADQTFSFEVQ